MNDYAKKKVSFGVKTNGITRRDKSLYKTWSEPKVSNFIAKSGTESN